MDELEMEAAASGDESSCSGSIEDCSPRIGDDYQVLDVPKLVTRDFLGLGSSVLMDEDEEMFALGRPVRVCAIHMLNDRKQGSYNAGTSEQGHRDDVSEAAGDDEEAEPVKNGKQQQQHKRGKKKKRGGWSNMRRLRAKNSCEEVIVPGDSFEAWNEDETAALILGLYLFGKDFVELKKFVETREMADLQHFYYSRFFGSAPYKRWFAARNNTSKRIVIGQQILVGWRQEELLRRISKELDDNSRPALFEAVTAFNKGDISFPAFVYQLRDAIGMELLVDAVGLGCGKRDITMGSADASVNNKKTEIPVGKAFSEFTASEMSRAISGSSRLSKTRAQDLFWEAIWPRLLAKDWSSEQSGSKGSSLVFMVPGIKRYSKRSLVKGKDYFDSISEVLHHLSTNPSLLELPELDNELLLKTNPEKRPQKNKRQEKQVKSPGERKHRPTLWLSKGTHHTHTTSKSGDRPSEGSSSNKELSAVSKTEAVASSSSEQVKDDTTGGQVQVKDESSLVSQLGLATTIVTNTSAAPLSASGVSNFSGGEGYELVQRKRRFYDAFPESGMPTAGLQAGHAAVSVSSGRKVWLHNVLKQHLGNGKSMRLYGPMVEKITNAVCQSTPRQKKLYDLLLKHQKAKSGVIDLFLRLDGLGKLGFSWQVESTRQHLEGGATMTICLEDQNTRRVEELPRMDDDAVAVAAAAAAAAAAGGPRAMELVEDEHKQAEEAKQVSAAAEDMSIVPVVPVVCHQSCRLTHKCSYQAPENRSERATDERQA